MLLLYYIICVIIDRQVSAPRVIFVLHSKVAHLIISLVQHYMQMWMATPSEQFQHFRTIKYIVVP